MKTLGVVFGGLWALAVIAYGAIQQTWIGFLVVLFLLTLLVFGYLKFYGKQGYRNNDYDPLKPDSELERTAFPWRSTLRFVVPYGVSYIAMTVAHSSDNWLVIIAFAVASGALLAWYFASDLVLPTGYERADKLFGESAGEPLVFEGPDAVVAFLHADQVVPELNQCLESALVKNLVKIGAVEHEVKAALNEADAQGRVVRIREMRHRGSTDKWLTLTKKSVREYQDSVRGSLNRQGSREG